MRLLLDLMRVNVPLSDHKVIGLPRRLSSRCIQGFLTLADAWVADTEGSRSMPPTYRRRPETDRALLAPVLPDAGRPAALRLTVTRRQVGTVSQIVSFPYLSCKHP